MLIEFERVHFIVTLCRSSEETGPFINVPTIKYLRTKKLSQNIWWYICLDDLAAKLTTYLVLGIVVDLNVCIDAQAQAYKTSSEHNHFMISMVV